MSKDKHVRREQITPRSIDRKEFGLNPLPSDFGQQIAHSSALGEKIIREGLARKTITTEIALKVTEGKPFSWACPECGALVTSVVRLREDSER